jgi:hypothetical protein
MSSARGKEKSLLEKVYREAKSRPTYYDALEQAAIFRQHLESSSEQEDIRIEDIDKHLFRGFLSYANRLYSAGEISESSYIALVTQAAKLYAERLIESRLEKSLKKYEAYLHKASLRWFS